MIGWAPPSVTLIEEDDVPPAPVGLVGGCTIGILPKEKDDAPPVEVGAMIALLKENDVAEAVIGLLKYVNGEKRFTWELLNR